MEKSVVMYITDVPNRKSPPTVLLRESYRKDGQVKNRTLANLTALPLPQIELLRRSLKGETFVSPLDFDKVNSWHHGHVDAVLRAINRLRLPSLFSARPSRVRDLVLAMIVGRILEPDNEFNSKLANPRWWHTTTLPSLLNVADAHEDELYDAMDWLLQRQKSIETKLASRHLHSGGLVLYDLTSSYFEGTTCPLAVLGYSRDGKNGTLQVNYGLLTNELGCPVAVSVFPGNTLDFQTVEAQTDILKSRFKLGAMVLVGDRGMITQKLIDDHLRQLEGIDWISALKSGAIHKLVEDSELQLSLFDQQNLFEMTSPDYPGERLVACRNPELAKRRDIKRRALLDSTKLKLQEVQQTIEGGKLRGKDKIARRLKQVVQSFNVAARFHFEVQDDGFEIECANEGLAASDALAGFNLELQRIRSQLKRGRLLDTEKQIKRVTEVISKYGLTDHIHLLHHDTGFQATIADSQRAGAAALQAVRQDLERVRLLIQQGRYGGKDAIGLRIGKVVNKYKVAKHFTLTIRNDGFEYSVDEEKVAAEASLDGIYVVRTSLTSERLGAEDTVRSYKSLSQVERAFRTLKTVDLKVRPIRHHLESRVRAHIFLCMLAYYVEWHMREAWRPLLFADQEQEAKKSRDPVAPAKRSESAEEKALTKRLEDGSDVHSFRTLLKLLSQIVRTECHVPNAPPGAPTFEIVTTPNEKQEQAYELLDTIRL